MRKVLFLLRHADPPGEEIFPHQQTAQDISVILIQDAVTQPDIRADHVYVLSDDAVSRKVTPAFPVISYQEMVRLIFDADSVVAL